MLRKAVMITATLTLGLGAVGIGIHPSGAESGTHCTFQHVPNLNPGLSYKPSTGTFTDSGGGTIECKGTVNGATPSGPGSYTDSGTVAGTCQDGGKAEGDPTFTIPTDQGPQTLTDHVVITFKLGSINGGVVHAEFDGTKTKGTIEITPTKGDCAVNPVTQIKGVGEFTLK
jgi:hypothetical protein